MQSAQCGVFANLVHLTGLICRLVSLPRVWECPSVYPYIFSFHVPFSGFSTDAG